MCKQCIFIQLIYNHIKCKKTNNNLENLTLQKTEQKTKNVIHCKTFYLLTGLISTHWLKKL